MLSKTLYICTFTLLWTTKNITFHACACIVRLQVLMCYVNTCLQRIINSFLIKKSGLTFVCDPRNVLGDKEGHLIM